MMATQGGRRLLETAEVGVNLATHGPNEVAERITRAVGTAGIAVAPDAIVCVAIAGAMSSGKGGELASRLEGEWKAGRVKVISDAEAVLANAALGLPSLAILAGTGSCAVLRAATGKLTLVGGYGPVLGDPGSGSWIGAWLHRTVLAGWEVSAEHLLQGAVLEHWGATRVEDLRGVISRSDSPVRDVAAVAPIVLDGAESGLLDCRRVVLEAADDLASMALRACRGEEIERAAPLLLAGGLFQSGYFRALVDRCLVERTGGRLVRTRLVTPLAGAWRLTSRAASGPGPAAMEPHPIP